MSRRRSGEAAAHLDETRNVTLWVVPVSDLGGVARHVLDVASRGIPGWRMHVLCPEGPLAEELRLRRATVHSAPIGPGAGLASTLRTLRRTIRDIQPRIVHSHLAYADIATALAVPTRASALISTEHGIAPQSTLYHASRAKAEAMRAVHSIRVRRCDRMIAVSHSTSDLMRQRWRPAAPIDVIHNGVDPVAKGLRGGDDAGLHVVSVSRLAPEKRIPLLLEAFSLLRRTRPLARLTVAGAGPDRDSLVQRSDDLGLSGAVSFPGHVEADSLMSSADVLVQLSAWENCSYSLLDASVRGLGVVATPVGGNPEILPERCLVAADDPALIAGRILDQASPTSRPALPAGWPTIADMTTRIAETYSRVGGRP